MKELQKSRYLFLVKQEKNLKQKGERLSSSDSRELFDYRCFLVTQIAYNQRFDYLSLFENYVTGKIPLYHFYFEFNTLYQELNRINMDVDQLSNFTMEFEIASKMGQFTDLIIDLWYHYEHVFREEGERSVWESNYQPNFESSINLIHTTYQEIKKCLE